MEQCAEFLRGGRSTLEKLAQAIVHPVIFEVELERIRAQVGNGVVSDLSAAIRTRDRVTVRHMIFNVGSYEDRFVMRIVSFGDKPKSTHIDRIPLSQYRNGLYLRDDPGYDVPAVPKL